MKLLVPRPEAPTHRVACGISDHLERQQMSTIMLMKQRLASLEEEAEKERIKKEERKKKEEKRVLSFGLLPFQTVSPSNRSMMMMLMMINTAVYPAASAD
jgi:hypothetical protein